MTVEDDEAVDHQALGTKVVWLWSAACVTTFFGQDGECGDCRPSRRPLLENAASPGRDAEHQVDHAGYAR